MPLHPRRGAATGRVIALPCFSATGSDAHINATDKVLLPQDLLEDLHPHMSTESPLLFLAGNRKIARKPDCVACSVHAFTAAPNRIIMPAWIMQALKLFEGQTAYLTITDDLPTAEYCKFEVIDERFMHLPNHAAVLERSLDGNFRTITPDTTITIRHMGTPYLLKVVEVEPQTHCSLLNADVEVDVAGTVTTKAPVPKQEHFKISSSSSSTSPLTVPTTSHSIATPSQRQKADATQLSQTLHGLELLPLSPEGSSLEIAVSSRSQPMALVIKPPAPACPFSVNYTVTKGGDVEVYLDRLSSLSQNASLPSLAIAEDGARSHIPTPTGTSHSSSQPDEALAARAPFLSQWQPSPSALALPSKEAPVPSRACFAYTCPPESSYDHSGSIHVPAADNDTTEWVVAFHVFGADGADSTLQVQGTLGDTGNQSWSSHAENSNSNNATSGTKQSPDMTSSTTTSSCDGAQQVSNLSPKAVVTTANAENVDQGGGANTSRCPICGKAVPAMALRRHTAYCERNTRVCKECGLRYTKTGTDDEPEPHSHCRHCQFVGNSVASNAKHAAIFHTMHKCACGTTAELMNVNQHRRTACPLRRIVCRFCHNEMEAGPVATLWRDKYAGFTQHESECGSRTETCYRCDQRVKLRDMDAHQRLHDLREVEKGKSGAEQDSTRAPPSNTGTPCVNTQCDQETTSSVRICRRCRQRISEVAGVALVEADLKALLGALVKAYINVATIGCGSEHCRNELCRSSPDYSLGDFSQKEIIVRALEEARKFSQSPPTVHICLA